jgi:hypothetical protein
MRLSLVIGAALVAASALAHAQSPQGDAKARRFDCSQAKDPKACEERLAKAKAVRQACDGKQGSERRDCLQREYCAQAQDKTQCEARVKEAFTRRERIVEACKDKKGEEHRACLREQRSKHGKT